MRYWEPTRLGRLELKNGLIMAPVKTAYGNPDGRVTDRHLTYYSNIAGGGAAMVILEPVAVTQSGKEHPKQLTIHLDTSAGDLSRIVSVLHERGAAACLNINHAGRAANPKATGEQPLAPSPVKCPTTGQVPAEMTAAQIDEILEGYRTAIRRAAAAGFDAIEVQCGHGYLVSQFLSPRTNRRDDEYGRDRELFMKKVFRIAQEERVEMGVIARISGSEFVVGGARPEDNRPILELAAASGFDAIHCGNGNACDSPPWYYAHMGIPQERQLEVFRQIREMTELPLILAGKMSDAGKLDLVDREALADAVAFGRALVADPELPNKLIEGRGDEVMRCGFCLQGCLANVKNGRGLGCIVNPGVDKAPSEGKTTVGAVAVVGGGPAGMAAAAQMARAGAAVTLFERESALGGQFRLAPMAPFKEAMGRPLDGLIRLLEREVEDVRLESDFTPEMADGFDHVIVATGSRQNIAQIENLDSQHWMTSLDFFEGRSEASGERALVVGAGMVGMEAAEILLDRGFEVVATKRTDTIANDMEMVTKKMMLKRLEGNGRMSIMPNTTVLAFEEGGIRVARDGKEELLEPADTVVIASGMLPEHELAERIRERGTPVTIIGDADRPADIFAATQAGYAAADDLTA